MNQVRKIRISLLNIMQKCLNCWEKWPPATSNLMYFSLKMVLLEEVNANHYQSVRFRELRSAVFMLCARKKGINYSYQ